MSGTDWLVVAGAVAAIIWVNWYFFFAERGTGAPSVTSAAREESRSANDDTVVS